MKNRGFTLIEILIVLAIIAGVLAFAAVTTGGGGSQVRKASFEIVKAIRATYDTTLIKHEYRRLVFDLAAQKVSVDYSENPFFVRLETGEEELSKDETEEENEDTGEEGLDLNLWQEDDEEMQQATIEAPVKAEFAPTDDDGLEPFEMPKGARIMDVFVEHQLSKLEEGIAYLYFFPKGYTERAIIHLGNDDGEKNMTLVVNPLSGAVTVLEGYLEEDELEE
jgi:general secretion pathway protein H